MQRLGRCFAQQPRVRQKFVHQPLPTEVYAYVDSVWAGCRTTRKSTSGGVLLLGRHPLKAWASTQGVIALSSGEAEYYAAVKGASHGLGLRSMLADLGLPVTVHLATDSSAAKGITARRGLGKTRHLEVCFLWLQEKVASKDVYVHKIPGAQNPADLFTKHLAEEKVKQFVKMLGLQYAEGRHPAAPECPRTQPRPDQHRGGEQTDTAQTNTRAHLGGGVRKDEDHETHETMRVTRRGGGERKEHEEHETVNAAGWGHRKKDRRSRRRTLWRRGSSSRMGSHIL